MDKKTSPAQRKATEEYLKKKDEFNIRLRKGAKEELKKIAEAKGLSLNSYIISLLEEDTKLELK